MSGRVAESKVRRTYQGRVRIWTSLVVIAACLSSRPSASNDRGHQGIPLLLQNSDFVSPHVSVYQTWKDDFEATDNERRTRLAGAAWLFIIFAFIARLCYLG